MTDDSAARHAALISVPELEELLAHDPEPVLLDVRWRVGDGALHEQYLAGHLPGAQWCDLDADLAAPAGAGGRHPLPDPARLQQAMRRWGITEQRTVVAYDGDSSVAAARAWWVLRWAGHDRVRVLQGGLAAWRRAGHPLQTAVSVPIPGTAVVRPGSLPVLDAAAAARLAGQGRLLDVRAPERFRGEVEPIDPVAGHIPGARNLPTAGNLAASGEFLPPDQLRERAAAVLPQLDEPAGLYCGSGVTAAHAALAMHQAGIPAVLYPGSWSEWLTDPSRPVAVGGE
jgi:thiosulfate/3-mercaptopyruvate sulfurtransferase